MSRKGEQEGLLKRLKIIESKNDQQLKAVKDQGEQQLDVTKKNDQLKYDVTKKHNTFTRLSQRLTESNFISFSNGTIDKLKKNLQIVTKILITKNCLKRFLFYSFGFLKTLAQLKYFPKIYFLVK